MTIKVLSSYLRLKISIQDFKPVYLDDEILGLLYIDDEDKDDISYDLNMSILQQDLDA